MYSIDTSALIGWWVRRYPPEVFPALQTRIEQLIAAKRLRMSRMVLDELGSKPDPLYVWAQSQSGFVLSVTQPVSDRAAALIGQFPILIDPQASKPQADPYVIALAETERWTVVTQETFAATKTSGKRRKRTYIPDICQAINVPCIDFLELMKKEGWKF
jgi:Domain of unknown function (DUF4411)